MTITYGRLCELAQEHGFEMDEKLRDLLRDVEAEARPALRQLTAADIDAIKRLFDACAGSVSCTHGSTLDKNHLARS
jgi:hypothetical protein